MKSRGALLQLKKLLPAGDLQLDPAVLENYSGDKWFARHLPDAVALPRNTDSVRQILRFASAHRFPVTARGAGYGYVGGCVPERGGIVLSMERMNRIKEINAGDFVAVAQPGVILKTLQDAVERQGMYYPPDPASRADCSLGGTVATNAGGPRCLKYGVTWITSWGSKRCSPAARSSTLAAARTRTKPGSTTRGCSPGPKERWRW